MTPQRLRYLAVLLAPLIGAVIAAPVASAAPTGTAPGRILPQIPASHARSVTTVPDTSPSAKAGFVQVASDGTVNHFTTYDSAGGTVAVSHTASSGQYAVTFGQLAFGGGDAQVTPIDLGTTCTIAGWGPSSPDLDVTVDCYDHTGAATDANFSLLVTQPIAAPKGVLDYAWAYTASGKLTGPYSYNSSHKANSIKHPALGHYIVTMPGPGLTGAKQGTVKVSPYGAGGGSCQVAAWHSTKTGQQVTVYCFASDGAPQNRKFTVVYARANNLMGQSGKVDANAYATGTAGLYQPAFQYDSKKGARVSIAHLDRGLYEALFTGSNTTGHFSGGLGNLQVTPVGTAMLYCGDEPLPTHNPWALFGCTNAAGHRVNSSALLQWVVN